MKKTVIFDLDGVQADTEPLHRESCRALLRLLHLDESIVSKAYTRSKREFWSETAKEYGLPFTADELTRREFALLIEIIEKSGLRPTDGLCETLENLRAAGIVCAVASSSDRVYVHTVLETLGLKKYFSAIACGDEVAAAKPAPDVYLRALALCCAKAENAAAVEDSDTGIAAAKAAGLFCIGYDAVPEEAYRQKFTLADTVVHDMRGVFAAATSLQKIGNKRLRIRSKG